MSESQGYGQNISSVPGGISCIVVCDLRLWQCFMQVDGLLKSRGLVASGATFHVLFLIMSIQIGLGSTAVTFNDVPFNGYMYMYMYTCIYHVYVIIMSMCVCAT